MSTLKQVRVLYVEGREADHVTIQSALAEHHVQWDVVTCHDVDELQPFLLNAHSPFDLIFCNHELIKKSGIFVFQELRHVRVKIPFVILVEAGEELLVVEALKVGIDDYIIKDREGAYLALLPIVLSRVVRVHRDRQARQNAERALQKSNDELELRVRDRTEELSRVNVALRQEMDVRKKVEEALRQSIERFNLAVQGSQDGLWEGHPLPGESWQSPRTPMWYSPTFQAMLGYEENELAPFLSSWASLLHPEDADRVFLALAEHIDQRIPYDVEYRLRTKDGEFRWFRARGQAIWNDEGKGIRMAGSLRDITDRKRTEEALQQSERQLRQAQKMEAIGTLAGGIAHDFNNILSAILGYGELALMNAVQGSLIHSYISEVITAGTRAKELVKQILAFSRETEQERRSVDLRMMVTEALRLLRPALPSSVEIRQREDSQEGCIIHADPTQIHQVLMNLGTNAEAAMRARGGVLEIGVTSLHLTESMIVGAIQLAPGYYAKLTVQDNGEGMSPDILDRIFDPFFTTKPIGEGTGMGLAVVHGIIVGHGGAITVASESGNGSQFDVYLPCFDAVNPLPFNNILALPTGHGKILFVDDEFSIARWGEQLLTYLGYDVVLETSAKKALDTFRRQPFSYDGVVTDQTMPEMTGEALAREILKVRTDIPIVLCTGFSHAMTLEKSKAMGIRAFLMKPVKSQQLAMTLQDILTRREKPVVSDHIL